MINGAFLPMMQYNNAAFGLQQTNQALMASMNAAGPNSNSVALGASDKVMALQHAKLDTMAEYSYAEGQAAQKRMKDYWKNRQQAIQNGYLF